MPRKPTSNLNIPLLALLTLTLIISLATLVCAAKTLHLFDSQQSTNPWLLPIWRNHFDLRGLRLVVGTSAAIVLLDGVAVVAMLVVAFGLRTLTHPPALLTITALSTLLSTLLSLPAAVLPLVLNSRAPGKDTLQSWTCSWVSQGLDGAHNGKPTDFGTVCGESRFATSSPLALLLLHLFLLALSLLALRQQARSAATTSRLANSEGEDGEKMVELGEYEKFSPSPRVDRV